jgi:hypothetical protein|tara:strand:- start:225 stop:632 length:408 start_codon:yes stop_codon:yes gene_type:complete
MKYAVLVFLMIGTAVNAESSSLNLALPSTPGNYQSDKFRAGELDCSNAIGSATNLEFGVTGIISNGDYTAMNEYINGPKTGDVGVYARITIPLGKVARSRIDCNRLYELELQKKQLEVYKLQQEVNQLKQLQFEE